ncbi:MAG TPA: hypothetical protein VGM77_00585 [Gemmatimonadales bacterium]|jgi:hypothetical protein
MWFQRSRNSILIVAGVSLGSLVLGACGSDSSSSDDPDKHCQSRWDETASSPSSNFLTLNGSFVPNETITLQWTGDNNQAQALTGDVSSSRSVLTYANVPSGTRTYTVSVSCTDGVDDYPYVSFTVK